MNEYRSVYSLRVWYENKNCDQIMDLFQKNNISSEGNKNISTGFDDLELNRLAKKKLQGYVSVPISINKSQGIELDMFEIVSFIDTIYKNVINDIIINKGKVDLFIGFFFKSNSGFEISQKLCLACADIGLGLSFDLYGDEDG